jgi:TPR repeat protein
MGTFFPLRENGECVTMDKETGERLQARLSFFDQLKSQGIKVDVPKSEKFDLIDKAARGDVEAAFFLAEGYAKGTRDCEKSPEKAKKWAGYAAKRGNEDAKKLLLSLGK